ncbi:MAG: Gfo/Idh/MocA family oxidoreductase [Thermoleophilia bacterium]|nr:Gfo/Idh/MocA family oxidoreductase [Thermoleophilia bacterium]
MRYRVGVLGNCCTHGEFVVAALRQEAGAELVAGWEADPRRAPALAALLGVELAESPEALIADPRVDIVAVSCDPRDKARWVEHAAAAGKHVFLNKPFAESLESARRIEAAVERHGVQLVHDIVVHRFHPVTAKLLAEVRGGAYGEPLHHAHSFGMTFSADFPLATLWPERLDPPGRSGGGELTNLGCYPIDYLVALWGLPRSVQAKSAATWQEYREAGVESFGQIVADYGSFFAVIAAGKQRLRSLPSMGLAEALAPSNWHNVLDLRLADANLTVLPYADLVLRDGEAFTAERYLSGFRCETPFEQLVRAIETGEPPDSGAAAGRAGVEVTMAAYRSIVAGGAAVSLPLADGSNPLAGG